MSRCSICDYSQSADSLYHNSLALSHPVNNRVVYSPDLKKDVCVTCLEDHLSQQAYWSCTTEIDDVPEAQTEEATDYAPRVVVEAD